MLDKSAPRFSNVAIIYDVTVLRIHCTLLRAIITLLFKTSPSMLYLNNLTTPAKSAITAMGIYNSSSIDEPQETADLVSNLKSRLNIPDMPMGGFSAAAAPAPAAPVEEEEAAPAAQEKTLFTLTLKSFDAASKPKVIKEIKGMLGLSLVDSKKFVESAPKQMKEGVPKEESEKIIETMKGLGAVVTMD